MRPTLDPAGHRIPRTQPTCLLHTWRPHWQRPFALVFHPHQHESSRNLHLQYSAKNQSTQHCQSLITQGSDHPPVLEPHMVLRWPHTLGWMSRRSSRPWGISTHCCRTPGAAHLYNSPSTRMTDLTIRAMRLASDHSEGSSPRSIQAMYLSCQSSARGAGSVSMGSASSAPYPSSKESMNSSFEGSSSIGSAPAGFEGALEGSLGSRALARG
jgi:hypothetical protein